MSSAIVCYAQSPPLYNQDIRPILAENCFACHGADSASRKADLRLDRREDAIDFGAIAPGSPDESELIARVLSDDPDLVMPPPEIKKTLTPAQKKLLQAWVASGAEYQPHWSFIPPQQHHLQEIEKKQWPSNDIDHHVLARLEERGLAPAAEADSRTLFRRLHLDITGLPPSPADTDQFVADYEANKEDAISNWIDRLMDSPTWGEHSARYWLDAARYGDTHGLHYDNYREIWPYRDWVIRAFNANQPFDQFIIEQLAGDLLPDPTDEQLIATGFQRCNITTNEGGTIDAENRAIYAADHIQTFGWVFLGLTTNCCQCHDHKFDPLTMRDYYSLAAFFRNNEAPPKDGNSKDGKGPVMTVVSAADKPRWKALTSEIVATQQQLEQQKATAQEDFQAWQASIDLDNIAAISTDGQIVHVPLTRGSNGLKNLANEHEPIPVPEKIEWDSNGRLGPAPILKRDTTFDLGSLGDFEIDQSFSYGGWLKLPSAGRSHAIIAKMNSNNRYRGWDLWLQGGALAVHLVDSWDDNALKVVTRKKVVKPGQWQHVFATYDGSSTPQGIKIYVDGKPVPLKVEKNSLSKNASIRSVSNLRIGQRSAGHFFQRGSLQDVRVFSRLVEEEEVNLLIKNPRLQSIIRIDPEQRTDEDNDALLTHYLSSNDEQFGKLASELSQLEAEQAAIRKRSPITYIQKERQNAEPMAHILMRGEYDQPGEKVKAAPPAALHPMPENAPNNRLGLAMWVTDKANPLTARVVVNRFWQELFGQGLVTSTEDFGTTGALPSHPELLDWLAIRFIDSGWDVKQLFKLMLMSSTYRQAAVVTADKLEMDPNNTLLSRGPRFRMDAEMVRDSALASSGLLSSKMYGPGVRPYQPTNIWDVVGLRGGDTRRYKQDKNENLYRRTIYNFWKRMAHSPNMDAFNAPSREVCTVRRERTNTPLQALVTLNDPQFVEAARSLAQNALLQNNRGSRKILDHIGRRVLARSFTPKEKVILLENKHDFELYYESNPKAAEQLLSVGHSQPNDKIKTTTLATWTMICSQVMNLDEAINK